MPDEQRVKALVPIEKYVKSVFHSESANTVEKKSKKKPGKILFVGYKNGNNQENKGCLNKTGTQYNQTAYLLHCNQCGFEYEANGCDVTIRRCPRCM